ncbi:hypothetical protein LTR01_008992 [Friedmanniomyces endolithicus]|nr:hypothetical protein LTR01_008992 [Friedmanniomyces endolithicus]KAK0822695.1 hypothetical protein LTR73_009106 [Friedmanniomyces endolithicus]
MTNLQRLMRTTTLAAISSAPSTMLARALTRALAYVFIQINRLHQLHHNRKYPLQLLRPLLRRRRQLSQPIRRHHHDLTFQSTHHDEDPHRLRLRRPGGNLHRAYKRHLRLPAPEHSYRPSDPTFLQQAADTTDGIYLSLSTPIARAGMLQYLMFAFLPDAAAREQLVMPGEGLPLPKKASTRFLLIMFGANDSRIQNSPGGPEQHVHIEDFTFNLRHMVQHPCVKAHGDDVHIILVTTPPIDERKCLRADQEKYPKLGHTLRRTAANTALYAQAIRDLGEELQIPVLDIHRSMLAHAGHDHLTAPLPGSMDRPTDPTL